MPNVTFSSPQMKKDVTVYAIAGDTKTLLAVAQAHNVPVSFECQNGECGSCQVQVTVLSNNAPIGVAMTEKEKTVLRLAGKITAEQIKRQKPMTCPLLGAWLASASLSSMKTS